MASVETEEQGSVLLTSFFLAWIVQCVVTSVYREASLDSSSPDFVPSLFVYTKQSQTPKTKMERYHRKRRRDERPDMQPASSMAEMEQDCTIDHCSDEEEAEGDRPVSRKEYDDLCFRHQLQEDYINLQQDCYKLRSENEELRAYTAQQGLHVVPKGRLFLYFEFSPEKTQQWSVLWEQPDLVEHPTYVTADCNGVFPESEQNRK
ncbi:uncharacterized protein LOC131546681 [Onychostoma macrolepis]|uniref:uncharacterized protein LOC131546681 n=1 Tax=Onychostoma macrolepis TaxID=369639 RepID=UPI00272D3096|nr:uncharacterized protein LOC131546681 [Onychostoma macrolepis]